MAIKGYVLDGGGPKDSENTHNSFLTKRDEDAFWQIGTDMVTMYVLCIQPLVMLNMEGA